MAQRLYKWREFIQFLQESDLSRPCLGKFTATRLFSNKPHIPKDKSPLRISNAEMVRAVKTLITQILTIGYIRNLKHLWEMLKEDLAADLTQEAGHTSGSVKEVIKCR